jgi:hypothetical protein
MALIEEDIIKHLHLCVALMSDPQTMLNYPGTVADHFIAALGKIEQLQVFLTAPQDHCANRHWVGNDILNGGIKTMVNIVLVKHMEPLRWKHPRYFMKNRSIVEGQRTAAPPVFAQELKQQGHTPCHETDLAREIKENNCMAALVLLNYYLYWHVLLISLNQSLHPCIGGQVTKDRPDIDGMLKKLPAFFDTLELRPMRTHLKRDYSRRDEGESLSDCSSDGDGSDAESSDGDEPRKGKRYVSNGILYDISKRRPRDDDDYNKGPNIHTIDEVKQVKPKQEKGDDDRPEGDHEDPADEEVEANALIRKLHDKIQQLMQQYTGSGAADGCMLSLPDAYCAQEAGGAEGDEGGPRRPGRGNARRNVKRASKLINLYRTVLASTSTAKKADVLLHYAHALGYAGREGDLGAGYNDRLAQGQAQVAVHNHLDGRIVENRDQCIIDSFMFNFHTCSVFDMQDSVQRWYDMCKPFEVKSLSVDDTTGDIDCTQKRYTCILSEVMKHGPLNMHGTNANPLRKMELTRACIHDFNSASLMMDICASFLKMHAVVLELR